MPSSGFQLLRWLGYGLQILKTWPEELANMQIICTNNAIRLTPIKKHDGQSHFLYFNLLNQQLTFCINPGYKPDGCRFKSCPQLALEYNTQKYATSLFSYLLYLLCYRLCRKPVLWHLTLPCTLIFVVSQSLTTEYNPRTLLQYR